MGAIFDPVAWPNAVGPYALVLHVLIVSGIYLVPAAVALSRRHPQSGTIALLNFLLGWTAIGWMAALIWSLTGLNRHAAAPAVFR